MVYEKVQSIIANQLRIDADTIQRGSSIKNDLGADSLDFLDILMDIEETFSTAKVDVNIPDKKMRDTVGDIVDYIEGEIGYDPAAEVFPLAGKIEQVPA